MNSPRIDKVTIEASIFIIPMYRRLVEEGYDITVSHPKKTQLISEARIQKRREGTLRRERSS